ncbi:MAG: 2-C-methyl-D-erythritol 2,4-cyclodiphosphate synthase [Spirochaetaceae bacterium]|jgi:2-C-methyl-D-erythritol 2,4-cyclodiphosphate synthase/2-C-methyl-D-erythritol 4-phosphate cytidylyltransferase/2-C-methyl-D-erythritol 2,4-cyclodiphosphate synthase|nr:2-C-methyl-D-erythritol 2,4-cyclodiphosphate synthase [Spirochaetaceae bacterium]
MEDKYRIGIGRDIHRLTPGRPFLLGGVRLEAEFGEDGHSDGDVLCHAVIDAMLGAAGLGDIGELFPPGEAEWKDANSIELLKICVEKLRFSPWRVANVDCVVSCERPAVLPYRAAIRQALADALDIEEARVFVKGMSGEKLGDIGQGRAVEAMAVCLLEREQQ